MLLRWQAVPGCFQIAALDLQTWSNDKSAFISLADQLTGLVNLVRGDLSKLGRSERARAEQMGWDFVMVSLLNDSKTVLLHSCPPFRLFPQSHFRSPSVHLCTHHLWYMCMVSICILVAMYYIDSISQLCYWSLARALSVHDDVPGKPETTGCRQCRLNSVLGRMPFSDLIASSLLWPTASTKTSPQPGKH